MASIRTEALIDASPDEAWAALRDWGAPHEVLVPGFVVATELKGDDRVVTFFNGMVVTELLVDLDDDARRLVWSVADGSFSHHNASAQVLSTEDGRTRFVWVADFLPHEVADGIRALMERGTAVIKQTIKAKARVA